MKRNILTILAVFFCIQLPAQRAVTVDNASWYNPWLGSGNMAALKSNSAMLAAAGGSVSELSLTAAGATGSFKSIYDPASAAAASLKVESFTEVGKVNLYGRFGYNYDYGFKSTWRGAVRPYESPFMLADSIPGNTTMETYTMQAGISIPFGRWAAGLDVSYDVGIFAKLKDLRNRNTDMTFRISPSLVFNSEHFNIGFNAGYASGSELVEYTKIADISESYLFYLYGLWVYNSYGYDAAENSRISDRDNVFGGIQFDIRFGDWTLFIVASADWGRSSQTEIRFNNLKYGNIETLRLSDRLTLQKGISHRITAAVSSMEMAGEKFLQRQELDPASSARIWVTYGDPIPCYARFILSGNLEYTFRRVTAPDRIPMEFSAGATDVTCAHMYDSYPMTFSQKLNFIEGYVSFTKRFFTPGASFTVNPAVAYRQAVTATEDDVVLAQGTSISGDPRSLQMMVPLTGEFAFLSGNCLRAGLNLGFETGRFFTGLSYRYDWNVKGADPAVTGRHNASIKIGFAF